jgi:hypothetical protein
MKDQYVISAILKDDDMYEKIIYVTDDVLEANNYDVSPYESPWDVWYTHFILDENNIVIDQRGATLLYPLDEA